MLFGGIEAGGTKMVCGIGDENGVLKERVSFPTRQPEETFRDMIGYFRERKIEALGIGCFGPVDLNRNSKTYGYITSTPKPGWANCDIVGVFRRELNVPVGFDTDVNGAVLGEVTWGAAKGCESALYITIGTGVGVGVYCNGALVHGMVHPEAGHIRLARHPADQFEGCCPFHPDCMESLASGPSIAARWGAPAVELADRPEVWEMEAYYIGQALSDYILCYSPQKIILWGGVMHQAQLFDLVRAKVQEFLNGYISHELVKDRIDEYIVPPALGDDPGILGAVRLGQLELEKNRK